MIAALLFDLDGTLIETHEANFLAYNSALKLLDLQMTPEEFGKTIGKDSREFLLEIFPQLTKSNLNLIRDHKRQVYSQYFSKMVVNDFFINLISKNRDKKIVVVTNGKSANVMEVLKYHGLVELFDHIVTGDDVDNGKPSNEIYLLALKVLKLTSSQVVAFEDSESGRQSAIAAGILCVNV
jgi:HAD superfamily hydrolase (TIGR01509 family)